MNSDDGPIAPPLFILGQARSGTTLVQRILNMAAGVAVFGEHDSYLSKIAEGYFIRGHAQPSKGDVSPDFEAIVERLRDPENWVALDSWFDREAARRSYAELVRSLTIPESASVGRYWGFKEIGYGPENQVVEMLAEVFPDARFVQVVRHPLDVLASQKAMGWGDVGRSFDEQAAHWARRCEHFSDLFDDQPERGLIVRYEDIVGRTEAGLQRLFDWLGLDLGEEQLAVLDLSAGRAATPVGEHGVTPLQRLSSGEIASILMDTRRVRRSLGYSVPGRPMRTGRESTRKQRRALGTRRFGRPSSATSRAEVLSLCDGSAAIETIATVLCGRHGDEDPQLLLYEASEVIADGLALSELVLLVDDREGNPVITKPAHSSSDEVGRVHRIYEQLKDDPASTAMLERLRRLEEQLRRGASST